MTAYHDNPYTDALEHIMDFGESKGDRTGTGTISTFGLKMSFDLQEGFPLMTTKRIYWKGVINELMWFLRGGTNIKWLNDRGVKIWDEWADDNGDLGPVYGSQWRSWPTAVHLGHGDYEIEHIDQLQQCVNTLMLNPNDRRMIVSAWNVGQIEDMALPACHLLFQFYVRDGVYLDCQMYQRSCDFFLGVPFNIASYGALMHLIGRCTTLKPGVFHWIGGDCHIYQNHVKAVEEQLSRTPKVSPTLEVLEHAPYALEGWTEDHFRVRDYDPHPVIRGAISV